MTDTISFVVDIPPGGFVDNERRIDQLADELILDFSDMVSRRALTQMRRAMQEANLGNLRFALGQTSDKKKTGRVFVRDGKRSASGIIFIRSRSQRTIGAIISYTEGAEILPRRGRWLWIPTDEIRRRAGVPLPRTGEGRSTATIRVQPRFWARQGLDRKIGKLQFIVSNSGTPLLIVRDVAVNAAGKPRSARARLKSGRAPKNFVNQDFIVAFIGIPNTNRGRRISPVDIAIREVSAAEAVL